MSQCLGPEVEADVWKTRAGGAGGERVGEAAGQVFKSRSCGVFDTVLRSLT